MPQTHIFLKHELPTLIECQILSFLRATWPEGFTGNNLYRDWISPDHYHPVHVVITKANVLIAHTEILTKIVVHGGEAFRVRGLSGVFVYPQFRNQGFGRQIVDAGTAYIQASDADIGMFHCERQLTTFYAGSGWRPYPHARTLVGDPEAPARSTEIMMALFLSERGQAAKSLFEYQPFYFGDTTW